MNKSLLIVIDVVIVITLLVVAGVYFTHQAGQLPSWFPGYSAGSSTIHVKHGLAAVIVAIGAAIFGWFATGPKAPAISDSARPE